MGTVIATVQGIEPVGDRLEFFVPTGSLEPPIVCLAENNGFPEVRSVYAKAAQRQTQRGVRVTLLLAEARGGDSLVVNVFQADIESSGAALAHRA